MTHRNFNSSNITLDVNQMNAAYKRHMSITNTKAFFNTLNRRKSSNMINYSSNYFDNSSQTQSKAPKYPKKFTLKDLNVYFTGINIKDLE